MKDKLDCVLLIDDDQATNVINRINIEMAGITKNIEVADNGLSALDFLSTKLMRADKTTGYPCPDLIFLDINMPGMDGWEFLEEYAQLSNDKKAKIVVVMLTTSLNPDDKVRALAISDVDEFRIKPLNQDTIKEIIDKHFAI